MIPVFQELSEKIGKQKVIWRYDPIFFSDRYTKEYHLKAFKSIAEALCGKRLVKYDILITNDVETKRAGKDQKEDFSRK